MTKISKAMKSNYEAVDRDAVYTLAEAVKILKSGAKRKFDQQVEISMNTSADPKHAG